MALEAVGLLADALFWLAEFLARGLVGWRFLLSPGYRARTLARWQTESGAQVAIEVTGGAAGVLLTLLATWGAWRLLTP